MWVPFNPNYDGVIEEKSEELKNETLVRERFGTEEGNSGLPDA